MLCNVIIDSVLPMIPNTHVPSEELSIRQVEDGEQAHRRTLRGNVSWDQKEQVYLDRRWSTWSLEGSTDKSEASNT
jgi:hypothetical protein